MAEYQEVSSDGSQSVFEVCNQIVSSRDIFKKFHFRLTPSVIFLMIIIRIMAKYLDVTSVFDVRTNGVDFECSW